VALPRAGDYYGHGVNLLQPERCARAALTFWDGAR